MKTDEFAFINRQLAGMLKAGLPLEGALKQICADMRRGRLKTELEMLEADLAQGVPLRDAVSRRKLPELYVRLIQVGARGNDLPGVLTMLADYYQRLHTLKTRLKGLLVYPGLVLLVSLGITLFFSVLFFRYHHILLGSMVELLGPGRELASAWPRGLWVSLGLVLPPLVTIVIALAYFLLVTVPRWRDWAASCLPGFKEARVSRLAGGLGMLLKSGCSLKESIELVLCLERGTRFGHELQRWLTCLAGGKGKFADFAPGSRFVPPLFYWLVAAEGEDCPAGLAQAAQIYYARAMHRMEVMLAAVMPVSIILLGLLLGFQLFVVVRVVFGGMLSMIEPF